MWRGKAVSALIISLLPLSASAIEITEVAWMGNNESHYCEWIELYNDSSQAVDLSAWQLQVDDAKTDLGTGETGDFVISPQSYRLIERTTASCPDPVPGEAGIKLSFGGLPNSGATVSLINEEGAVVASLAGGEDWQQIGGDNESKETAQYSEGGWLTAPATPGEPAVATSADTSNDEVEAEQDNKADKSNEDESDESSGEATELELPDGEFTLAISGPTRVYKNQPVKFSTTPRGVVDGVRSSLVYSWNFGDTNTRSGREVEHTYKRAGTYVVTVYATYARHEALATKTVTVVPNDLELSRAENGDLLIHNPATYAMNISGYKLQGQRSLVFPDHSYVASKQTLTIPRKQIENGTFSYVALFDAVGTFVASTKQEEENTVTDNSRVESETSTTSKPESEVEANPQVLGIATDTEAVRDTDKAPRSKENVWYEKLISYWEYGALAGLLAVAAYLLLTPSPRRSENDFFS